MIEDGTGFGMRYAMRLKKPEAVCVAFGIM
jgi:hypothetical protein